jgi:Na+-translocating ferredoxin:NAD+ oxidoreductase RNF subunit RnfB
LQGVLKRINMNIVTPVLVLGSLGAVFGLWLAIVQKVFAVTKDKRIEHIFSLLPGSNCGACGKAGCHGLAEALAKGEVENITCPVLHEDQRTQIAGILGIEQGQTTKKIATLICAGGRQAKDKLHYNGPQDCNISILLMGGPKACAFGCVGFGSCEKVCPFDAISIQENGLPKIDAEKCTACGKCITVCPKNVLILTPEDKKYHIQCNSTDKGAEVMKACKVGCIGCGKCLKECPVGAITLDNNLAKIDYEKCINCGKCIKVCPTKAIGRRENVTEGNKPE